MKKTMGQSPLILGPSSWGAGMMSSRVQLVCPPGTRLTPQGGCIQPQATIVGGILRPQSIGAVRK